MADTSNLVPEPVGQSNSTKATVERFKILANDKLASERIVSDQSCFGGLVLILSNDDPDVAKTALEVLHRLAEWPELRVRMRNFVGVMEQLQDLMACSMPSMCDLAKKVYDMLISAHTHSHSHHSHSSSHHGVFKNTINQQQAKDDDHIKKPKRRNSFFVGGTIGKNKTVMLQIRGMNDKEDIDVCRNSLLTVKGVISITFDSKKKRAILRTKLDVRPELLAQAVARTMTMAAEQVIKNENGDEVLVSFRTQALGWNKENEDLPDYPSDESPVKGENDIARIGEASPSKGWGFLKSGISKVSNFMSNTLYW